MYSMNRAKLSTQAKGQNQGLASELGGYEFKPRMNKTSLDLAQSMKSIQDRLPEMIAEKKKALEKKRKEKEDEEFKECTFTPTRLGASVSDKYLKRMGRDKSTPDDFLQFKEEQLRRNIQRKNIIDDLEARELTFKPQISQKSKIISEKLKANNSIVIDPTTKVQVGSSKKRNKNTSIDTETCLGPPLILESEHPYRNSTCEFTTVNIPGAFSYSITFDEQTETENVHDYIKFFHDDTHTDFYGYSKYSGGLIDSYGNKSSRNWPGIDGRPPLLIPASRFVFHFKTNSTINGWGFKMIIVPTVSVASIEDTSIRHQPSLIARNRLTPKKEVVHERLYKAGLEKFINDQSLRKDAIQATLNVKLKISEKSFGPGEAKNQKSISKLLAGPALTDLIIDDDEKIPLTVIEFDESYRNLWKCLNTCTK